jgi:predicted MFS family arabinose efflux permease
LLASAFLNGLFMSFWAVSYSPAIAGLSNPRNRQLAFSLACAAGMSIGIVGGLVGGVLPGVLQNALHLGTLESRKSALLAAGAFAALGAVPAAKLRFERIDRVGETRIYPRSRFLTGFLAALCCWSVAVGMFNPFFNAFFSVGLGMGIENIGLVYSCAHLFQVLAVLAAPIVLRRLGDVRGIASMQLSAGLALALLAVSPAGAAAALAYTGYMSFQYMSEPGMFKMLMSRVAPTERSGASALYFLVTSLAASLSALAGGTAISHFGYPVTLIASAVLAIAAAVLFRKLIHDEA